MEILDSTNLRKRLADEISHGQQSITMASAFITDAGYSWLNPLANHLSKKLIIGRFAPSDFCFGASSFSVLARALDDGWKLGLSPNLHSKVTIVDSQKIFLGSSNLTSHGLGLNSKDQKESNVFFETETKPSEILDHLLMGTRFLTEVHVEQMEDFMKSLSIEETKIELTEWPKNIVADISDDGRFFSSDFPDVSLNEIGTKPSCFFSELHGSDPKKTFISSNAYNWLVKKLNSDTTSYTNFGWLTKHVHESLLDIPPLQRADVKVITALLFDFVEAFSDEIVVKQHKRTKSMHFKS